MEENKKTCYCETDVLNDSMINEVEDSSVEQNSAAIQDELESNEAFKSYVKKIADNIVKDYPHIRYGQAVFNFVVTIHCGCGNNSVFVFKFALYKVVFILCLESM